MKSKISFIYFDVGGVILRWRGFLTFIANKHQKKLEDVETIFYKYDEACCRGLITPRQLWKKYQQELNLKTTKYADIYSLAMKTFEPIVETHQFIKKIINHLPVGILTNVYQKIYDLSLKHGHVPNLKYAAVIESCKIGLIKPEKEIYLYAQRQAKVNHENILFVDDYVKNVESAKQLGWQALLFETDNPQKSISKILQLLKLP